LVFTSGLCQAQHYGDQDHPMNKDTDGSDILEYWEGENVGLKAVYDRASKILSRSKHAAYKDLRSDNQFKHLSKKYNVEKLGGPMLGNLRPDGVSVWVRTLEPAKVEVEAYKMGFQKKFEPVFSSEETDFMGLVEITGLEPQTKYFYRVFIDEKEINFPVNPHFVTSPKGDESEVRIAFGSCPHRWGLGNEKLLGQIKSRGN